MADPIRILHVIGSMNRGGAENMIMNFYRNIDREKVQFDFVENTDKEAAFDPEIEAMGGRIYRCPHYNVLNHFQYARWWNGFLKKHAGEYAAIHGHLGSTAAIYLAAAKKYGMYTIAHSHNIAGTGLKGFVYRIYAYPTRFIAHYFFACSEAAGLSRYGKRTCADRSHFSVLNNAIDTHKFAYDPDVRKKIRDMYGISGKLVLGHVGRLVEQKNHEFLLQIFQKLHTKQPESALLLIGEGELRDKLEIQAKELGISEHVIFAGVHSDVSVFYQAMDVFVFPSLFEGLGMVAVEAQTSGLPCVISDKVPLVCEVTEGLVTMKRLEDTPAEWAEHILQQTQTPRSSRTDQVAAHGYDIHKTAAWLQNFYLNIGGIHE